MLNANRFAKITLKPVLSGLALTGLFLAAGSIAANAQAPGDAVRGKSAADPPPAFVAGTLNLPGIAPGAPVQVFEFEFRPTDGSDSLSMFVDVGPDGSFSLTGVPINDYILHIDGERYLATDIPVNMIENDTTHLMADMRAGDINGDGIVDVSDMGIFINAYNVASDDSAGVYNTDADLNRDGTVDISDFSLLVSNYGQQSDP